MGDVKWYMDLRFFIGLLFIVYGVILAVYGLAAPQLNKAGWNLNLWWGLFMLVFGLIFAALPIALRNKRG